MAVTTNKRQKAPKQKQTKSNNTNSIVVAKQQAEPEAPSIDVADLNLNASVIDVIEEHMPLELFMEATTTTTTTTLTADNVSMHSTNSNSMSSSNGELQVAKTVTSLDNNLLTIDASAAAADAEGILAENDRNVVLVIITDYNETQ